MNPYRVVGPVDRGYCSAECHAWRGHLTPARAPPGRHCRIAARNQEINSQNQSQSLGFAEKFYAAITEASSQSQFLYEYWGEEK